MDDTVRTGAASAIAKLAAQNVTLAWIASVMVVSMRWTICLRPNSKRRIDHTGFMGCFSSILRATSHSLSLKPASMDATIMLGQDRLFQVPTENIVSLLW